MITFFISILFLLFLVDKSLERIVSFNKNRLSIRRIPSQKKDYDYKDSH